MSEWPTLAIMSVLTGWFVYQMGYAKGNLDGFKKALDIFGPKGLVDAINKEPRDE